MDDRNQAYATAGDSARSLHPAPVAWQRPSADEKLDEALQQTFPASDAFMIDP